MIWNSPSVSPLRFQITIVLTRSLALQKKILPHLSYICHTDQISFFLLWFHEFFFSIGLLKVAELLRVKGLVEGEGEKLLNPHIGKNGRPLVSTSMSDPPTSSSKLNGNGNDLRDRSEERRPTSDSKESPNGVPPGMPRFMPGMPQLPMPFGLPGMFPSLLGKNGFFYFYQCCQLDV